MRFHPRQLYPAAKQAEAQRVLLMLSMCLYSLKHSTRCLNSNDVFTVSSLSVSVEGIDPSYQSDSQNRRCALHAAAQRGLLEICYLLVQVRLVQITQRIFIVHRGDNLSSDDKKFI